MSPPKTAPEPPRPTRLAGWVLYALVAVGFSAGMTAVLPLWFHDTDADLLLFASRHGLLDVWGSAGVVGGHWRPVALSVAWLAFHAFGWAYWPYQLTQLLLWFATFGAYHLMLRNLWAAPRMAMAGGVLTALVFFWLQGSALEFAQIGAQLELILGFASVALAAHGWRYRRWSAVAGGLALAGVACLARESAALWLGVLHPGTALLLAWPRRAMLRWTLLITALVVLAAAGFLWITSEHWAHWVLSLSGQQAMGRRASFYAELMRRPPGGWVLASLAALAGLAQGMRLGLHRWPWMVVLAGGLALLASAWHPLWAVLVLAGLSWRAWPFALWALAMQAALLVIEPMRPGLLLGSSFAYVPAMLVAIRRSPMGLWVRVFVERSHGNQRTMVYSALLILAALALAHMDQPVRRHLAGLAITSQRRLAIRDLTALLAGPEGLAQRGERVGVASYSDLRLSPRYVQSLPPDERAASAIQFSPPRYQRLLQAKGREDLTVGNLTSLRAEGGWLLTTSPTELYAAQEILHELGAAHRLVQDGMGGLWHVGP